MAAVSTRVLPRRPPSPTKSFQLSELLPPYCCPTAQRVVGSYLWCWCKDRLELCRFGWSPRTDWAREGHRFRMRGFGGEVTDLAQKALGLKGWRWSTRTTHGAKSWRSLFGESHLPQHSAEGIETRHWQLR